MSHFSVLVIMNRKELVPQQTFKDDVECLLRQYDESIKVNEYDRKCYCCGNQAMDEIRVESDKKFGSWGSFRENFFNLPENRQRPDMTEKELTDFLERQVKSWKSLTKDKNEFETTALNNHRGKDDPNPDCTTCEGKGTFHSTYNPKSKWDYYQIGGGWSGECNSNKENIFKVKDVMGETFAVVTPDGEWHERGRMGWWCIVTNENENWNDSFKKFVEQYNENYAVVVDCHI